MQYTIQYKGETVSYTSAGSGMPVVLLHGFAEDATVWQYQVPELQQHCRVIAVDVPGSGQSGYNPGLETMDDFADCLYALLQQENITQCIMLGHSMGGYITVAFAEKYPASLAAFGFVHSTAYADSDEKKQNRLKGIKMIEEYGSAAFVKNTMPGLISTGYKQQFADKVNQLIQNGANFSKEALQQYYRAMMNRPDRTAVLRSSQCPVLFIAGTEDTAIPLQDALQQMHMPATCYMHILQNTAHLGMWEATEAVNKYVLQFIGDNER